jgi:N-acetylglucosaminyldiphosphoundecaprenol N-acetyl-beta-D-mannosaminyltransferase
MKSLSILNVKIDKINFNQVLEEVESFVNSKKPHQIATVNSEFIMAAQKDKEFMKILNSTDLSVPDGVGQIWASKFLYGKENKLETRIAGVDLVWEIAKKASENNWSIYFLGAKPGVAKLAANRLKLLHRNLKIAGISIGEPKYSVDQVVKSIHKSGADVLLVAYGAPKQEKFIFDNLNKMGVKVAIGVGGSFDFISGVQKRAPLWMRKIGFEWLYRLIREPKRIGRIFTAVIKFPLIVIISKYSK